MGINEREDLLMLVGCVRMGRPPTTISSAGGTASQGTEYAMSEARSPGGL